MADDVLGKELDDLLRLGCTVGDEGNGDEPSTNGEVGGAAVLSPRRR